MANHLPADLKTLDRAWGFIISSALLSIIVGSNLSQATPEGDALHIIKEVLHAEVNWTGNDPCQAWEGVSCFLNHVIGLNLSMKRLHGTLAAEIGQLSFLESLDISNNLVEGHIPIEIANLTNLRILKLDGNKKLSGPLPSDIGQLSSLEHLFLGNCSFTGPIPVEIGKLINLKILSIWGNVLNSTIPVELSKLTNLEYL